MWSQGHSSWIKKVLSMSLRHTVPMQNKLQTWLLTVTIRPIPLVEHSSDANSPPWGLDHQQTVRHSDMWLFEGRSNGVQKNGFGWVLGKNCGLESGAQDKWKILDLNFCLSQICVAFTVEGGSSQKSASRSQPPKTGIIRSPLGPHTLDDPWHKRLFRE